jgi:hypothetical protein
VSDLSDVAPAGACVARARAHQGLTNLLRPGL